MIVPVFEDVDASRISDNWCTRCLARAEIGLVKVSRRDEKGIRMWFPSSGGARFPNRYFIGGSGYRSILPTLETLQNLTSYCPLLH